MGRGFQRLDGLGQRPSQGQLIPIIFLSQGVGAGTGGAGSPGCCPGSGGGPPESGASGSPILNFLGGSL